MSYSDLAAKPDEDLLGGFSNDSSPGKAAPLKRDHDSMDDFEHLERDVARQLKNASDDLLVNLVADGGLARDEDSPVPATPPPSANAPDFLKFDERIDAKVASLAFLEAEKSPEPRAPDFGHLEVFDARPPPLSKMDDLMSAALPADLATREALEEDDWAFSREQKVARPPQEPPTKPLPPLPRDVDETRDSEFESEPEPSPAKASKVKESSRSLPGRKLEVEEIAPKDIFKHLNLGEDF